VIGYVVAVVKLFIAGIGGAVLTIVTGVNSWLTLALCTACFGTITIKEVRAIGSGGAVLRFDITIYYCITVGIAIRVTKYALTVYTALSGGALCVRCAGWFYGVTIRGFVFYAKIVGADVPQSTIFIIAAFATPDFFFFLIAIRIVGNSGDAFRVGADVSDWTIVVAETTNIVSILVL